MPPEIRRTASAGDGPSKITATKRIGLNSTPGPFESPRSPAAWCSNLTETGRLLPERWRVGKFERATLLHSTHDTIVDDIAHIACALVDSGEDPMDAVCQAGSLWRELVDDAACRAVMIVLDRAEAA